MNPFSLPMKYYKTEDECNVAAKNKAEAMIETFNDFGYYVESQASACQYVETYKDT